MTNEEICRVTEWLGEKRHENNSNMYHPFCCSCGLDFGDYDYLERHLFMSNCTFRTWDDFGACWDRLQQDKMYGVLITLWKIKHIQTLTEEQHQYMENDEPLFLSKLHSRTEKGEFTLCKLIAEALEEGVIK